MPASLTVQVRLGFSMGWRIWTPNEVGFYAKTLAHSYFILVILKSKFLKEMIWVVNYNLFMGTKKYHVFIEFLQFGMKSTEERCVWKKIIFISLIARHKKMTKAYFRFMDEKYKLSTIKDEIAEVYPYRGDQKAVLKLYESNIYKNTRLGFKSNHLKYSKKIEIRRQKFIKKLTISRGSFLLKKKVNFAKAFLLKYVNGNSISNKRFIKKLIKLKSKILEKKKTTKFIKKSACQKKKNNVRVLFFRKKISRKATTGGLFFRKNKKKCIGVGLSGRFVGSAENVLMESFRFDPVYMKNSYSVFGGPMKRLSRNLRRAFKGKHIKIVSDLVWFWEKISKMVTYFLKKHVLHQKRII